MRSRFTPIGLSLAIVFLPLHSAIAQHPLDGVFERADQSAVHSKSTVGSGAYRDLERSSNDARDKATALDEERQSLTRSASTSGSETSNSPASNAASTPMSSRTWVCRVFCKSSSGPVVTHSVQAKSRTEAAKYMDRAADQVCRNNGLSYASGLAFPERQCSEK